MKLPSCDTPVEVGDLVVVDSRVWDEDMDPCEVVEGPGGRMNTRKLPGLPRGAPAIVLGLRGMLNDAGKPHNDALAAYVLVSGPRVVQLSAWSLCPPPR